MAKEGSYQGPGWPNVRQHDQPNVGAVRVESIASKAGSIQQPQILNHTLKQGGPLYGVAQAEVSDYVIVNPAVFPHDPNASYQIISPRGPAPLNQHASNLSTLQRVTEDPGGQADEDGSPFQPNTAAAPAGPLTLAEQLNNNAKPAQEAKDSAAIMDQDQQNSKASKSTGAWKHPHISIVSPQAPSGQAEVDEQEQLARGEKSPELNKDLGEVDDSDEPKIVKEIEDKMEEGEEPSRREELAEVAVEVKRKEGQPGEGEERAAKQGALEDVDGVHEQEDVAAQAADASAKRMEKEPERIEGTGTS